METPFDIGYRLYKEGKGISDLWGAVKHDHHVDEAFKGYMYAKDNDYDKSVIPTLTEIVMKEEDSNNEVMDILQEECAEVIQAVSKIRRFGIDGKHPDKAYTNREHLEEEIGDLLAMIDILTINNIVEWGNLHKAKRAKIEKLKKWSNIPNLENI